MWQLVLPIAGLLGLPTGFVTVFFVVRNGLREARKDRESKERKTRQAAIEAATAPLQLTIESLRDSVKTTNENNRYYRQKIDSLERELRERGSK
jgi:hypothetical protein